MATSEALIKYYDCLKDSFTKIQDKDNKTALVNAALRPKIREEFAKSKDVLTSYLNYIQVFSLIYSDKFNNICVSIICPIFKENCAKRLLIKQEQNSNQVDLHDIADHVHDTLRQIVKSKPELAEELTHCLVKYFPTVFSDTSEEFKIYLTNALEICTYIDEISLSNIIAKILDRINPPPPSEDDDEENILRIRTVVDKSYELIYSYLDDFGKEQLEAVASAIVTIFTRDFLASDNEEHLNFLILYICSLDSKFTDLLITSLWTTFIDTGRPYEERRASVCFVSSFISRANYVELDKVIEYLEKASNWCHESLDSMIAHGDSEQTDSLNETSELFHDIVQSMLYLITQRHRELYEEETISRIINLNLDSILNNHLKPLDSCDKIIEQRFIEVASLYKFADLEYRTRVTSARKRRKSANDSSKRLAHWRAPFRETLESVPERVVSLYRNYYNHKNFTIYRD